MTEPTLAYVRSLVLTSLTLSVSSASHVFASGHLPAPAVILLLGVLLLLPMLRLSRRTVSFRTALLAMGAGQALLHVLFSLTAVPAVCRSSSAVPGHHAAFEVACSTMTPDQLGGTTGGTLMLLLHTVATIVLAVAVSRSDRSVSLLRAWLRPLLARPAVAPLPSIPPRPPVPALAVAVTPSSVHSAVPSLRGPPPVADATVRAASLPGGRAATGHRPPHPRHPAAPEEPSPAAHRAHPWKAPPCHRTRPCGTAGPSPPPPSP